MSVRSRIQVAALSLLLTFPAILGLGCVTAQSERRSDIGPHTYPNTYPQSTPSAGKPGAHPMPLRDPARAVKPTPTVSPVPPANQQSIYGL